MVEAVVLGSSGVVPAAPRRAEFASGLVGGLAAMLFCQAATEDWGHLAEKVALSSGHPGWLRALSCREGLSDGAWQDLWALGEAPLRAGLVRRRMSATQFATVISSGDDRLAAWAARSSPELVDAAMIRTLSGAEESGALVSEEVVGLALAGGLPSAVVTSCGADLDVLAERVGPLARLRLAAAAPYQIPAERVVEALADGFRFMRNATDRHAEALVETLARCCLALRPDLLHAEPGGRVGCEDDGFAEWLSLQAAELRRWGVPRPSGALPDRAEALMLSSDELLVFSSSSPELASDPWLGEMICSRLHTPSAVARYGARLCGADRCVRRWCRADPGRSGDRLPQACDCTGGLALARDCLSRLDLLTVSMAEGVEPVRPAPCPALSRLMLQACEQLGESVGLWETLCWLVDTFDGDIDVDELPGLARSI